MAKSKSSLRVADLKAKMKRITTALKAGDVLMDEYYERRATEIEAFNKEVSTFLGEDDNETSVN